MTKAEIKIIEGGVCAPEGFTAAGTTAGFRNKDKKDLALIYSEKPCSAAGVYTTNKVKGAPIAVTRKNIADGKAQAIICNSGNANTCAPGGVEVAEETCRLVGDALGIEIKDVIVCSTGVIGQELSIGPFKKGIPALAEKVMDRKAMVDSDDDAAEKVQGSQDAAEAIMTTDTVPKSMAVEFDIGGNTCRIGGIAKGSGMINPNMATMLAFITTDVAISSHMLQKILSKDVEKSFNQICVDGDTSTNDMVMVMANGEAGNEMIEGAGAEADIFAEALAMVTTHLAKMMAKDGEGATKLIECRVKGAPTEDIARDISKTVISSNLLKAAMFGQDANWGRVLCAVGYAPGRFSTDNVDVEMTSEAGSVKVCEGSKHKKYSEDEASKILAEDKIVIDVDLNEGDASATAWGCDLTYDYVRINGDYRT